MPPTAGVRKTSTTTTTATLTQPIDAASATRRTTSGRAVRANTTRPTNYYARPFASSSYTNATTAFPGSQNADADTDPTAAPGFFPALQHLSDIMTALPREVVRQFTLMKEVEAKILGPGEKLGEVLDELIAYPVPSRQTARLAAAEPGLLSFTANNSVAGSASVSLINGSAPPFKNAQNLSAPNSVSGSVSGEEAVPAGAEEEMAKRRKFHELRALTHALLPNLDEKNVVLAEANRVLKQQLSRLDHVMPHIENEISEEARLGSMTHWAYSDNRQKKHAGGTAANRRDVAATNNLAAAANAIHESDIAQARRDAVRDTTREKHKGKSKEHVDSDFEERPKKTHAKIVKNKAAGLSGGGLGNGAPVKKRKLDKDLPASSTLDRAMNAVAKGVKAVKETPRSTPAGEPGRKTGKAKPPPLPAAKKRNLNSSSHASPALASSPLQTTFSATTLEPQGASGRPQSARLKQNNAVTNLRHEKLPDEENARPTSAPGKVNGERVNGKRKAPDEAIESERAKKTVEREDALKYEEADGGDAAHASRSTSNSGRAGRGSKTGTPKTESFTDAPAMVRARSTRSMRRDNDEGSAEPLPVATGGRHKRVASNSHLVKQLAPFNRSPDLDRRHQVDDMDEDLESVDGRRLVVDREEAEGDEEEEIEVQRSPPKRRFSSRRNTGNLIPPPSSLPASSDAGEVDEGEDVTMPDAGGEEEEEEEEEEEAEDTDLPALEPEVVGSGDGEGDADVDDDEESEPGDPDDPNETKYCYCNRGSYGDMVACDNADCPREWFHLGCTDLTEPPEEIEKWYCDECKPLFVVVGKGRGKGRGVRK